MENRRYRQSEIFSLVLNKEGHCQAKNVLQEPIGLGLSTQFSNQSHHEEATQDFRACKKI